MNFSERLAKVIVEKVIPGATMRFQTSQGAGECDFELEVPDGGIVPLEVTTASDPSVNMQIAATADPRKGGYFVPRELSQRRDGLHSRIW